MKDSKDKDSLTAQHLYFPECKIVKALLVPKSTNVIFFNIKSKKNTPKHYPKHPLLEGKVEFTFGLELSLNFLDTKKSNYFNVFNSNISSSVSQLTGKTVSALIFFDPEGDKKLDTIGLGICNELITIYNDLWEAKEIEIVSNAAKLTSLLPNREKVKRSKI